MNYIYRVDGERADTTEHACGPWGPMQHGGAPASLIAWTAERTPSLAPMRIARLTVDLMRPVPMAPLTIDRRIVREGKKLQLMQINLSADGVEVVRASVLRLRKQVMELNLAVQPTPMDLPLPEDSQAVTMTHVGCAFNTGLDWRRAKGDWGRPGPSATWYRVHRPVIEGEAILPSMRAAIASDYCNGSSALFDFQKWTFINADLQVNLARDPVGDWVLLDSETYPGPDGGGVAFARLGDREGWFGRASQSVIFERRAA